VTEAAITYRDYEVTYTLRDVCGIHRSEPYEGGTIRVYASNPIEAKTKAKMTLKSVFHEKHHEPEVIDATETDDNVS
jgi:hypothetical protein